MGMNVATTYINPQDFNPGYGGQIETVLTIGDPNHSIVTHKAPKTVHIKKWDYGSQGGNGGSSLNVAIDCYKPPPSGFDICAFVTGLIGVFVPFIGPAFEKAGTVLSDTTKAIVSSAASGSSQFCMIK